MGIVGEGDSHGNGMQVQHTRARVVKMLNLCATEGIYDADFVEQVCQLALVSCPVTYRTVLVTSYGYHTLPVLSCPVPHTSRLVYLSCHMPALSCPVLPFHTQLIAHLDRGEFKQLHIAAKKSNALPLPLSGETR